MSFMLLKSFESIISFIEYVFVKGVDSLSLVVCTAFGSFLESMLGIILYRDLQPNTIAAISARPTTPKPAVAASTVRKTTPPPNSLIPSKNYHA